ncbi:hypothetical protein PRIC1_011636 [Phytophthora ramorum]
MDANLSPRSEFKQVLTPSAPDPEPIASPVAPWQPRSRLQTLLRSWMVLRWDLSRRIFSVPIAPVTASFDVKKGDVVLTFPVVAVLVIATAILAGTRSVGSSGTLAALGLLLVFFFAIRNNVLLLETTGISFERALFYHKLFAYTTIVLSALHGLAYLLAHHHGDEQDQGSKVATGTLMLVAMLLLFVLSLNVIRRRFFELFMRVHWVLFLVVFIVGMAHGAAIALIGIVPWIIDLVFRLVYRTRIYQQGRVFKKKDAESANLDSNRNVLSASNGLGVLARDQLSVAALPGKITRVSFPRVRKDTGEVFAYEAGQYAFLCVPSISKLQWHPFSISSSPHEDIVTFHVKAAGEWTSRLFGEASKSDGAAGAPFDVLLDGPYGKTSVDIDSRETYSHFALFAGGIGVTPMRSIVDWLHYERYTLGRSEIKRVQFVWSTPNRDAIEALLDSEVPNGEESAAPAGYFPHEILRGATSDAGAVFHSEFYLTRVEQDLGAPLDQQLGHCLRFGSRPDATAILRAMGGQAKADGKERVAVLVCGPIAMVRDVIATSLSLSEEMKVHFDVHSELFEF